MRIASPVRTPTPSRPEIRCGTYREKTIVSAARKARGMTLLITRNLEKGNSRQKPRATAVADLRNQFVLRASDNEKPAWFRGSPRSFTIPVIINHPLYFLKIDFRLVKIR
jgi:hypothetical protein